MLSNLFVAVLVVAGTGWTEVPARKGCASGKSCCGARLCCAVARAETPKPAETKVHAARAAYEATFAAFRAGKADAEKVYLWSRRWMESGRDLKDKKTDPATGIKDHLARMKVLRQFAQDRYKAGQATHADILGTDFYIAEAEVWLTRTKAK